MPVVTGDAMIPADPAPLERLMHGIATPLRLLTLAPERPGALAVVQWRATRNRHRDGHTAADLDTVRLAAEAGMTLSTHLGNALPQPQRNSSIR